MSKPAQDTAPAPEPTRQELVKAKVSDAYGAAIDKSREVIASVESNPLVALLGGLAIGAAAGALLPRSEKEKALLAPLGEKLAAAATAAIAAGREAGTAAIADAGLSSDALRDQVANLVSQAGQAASAAGTAAFTAARDSVKR